MVLETDRFLDVVIDNGFDFVFYLFRLVLVPERIAVMVVLRTLYVFHHLKITWIAIEFLGICSDLILERTVIGILGIHWRHFYVCSYYFNDEQIYNWFLLVTKTFWITSIIQQKMVHINLGHLVCD